VVRCAVQDADYIGLFVKWRCTDGAAVSVKLKYRVTLIHRHDYTASRQFTTTQRFTSSQTLLGKTRFIAVSELMDVGCGFLSDSARNAIIELQLNNVVTYFEKIVDISPANRTRKNASGVYFDTSTFQLAEHRWYMRFYVNKVNSAGLPAVYLYLSGKAKSVVVELEFTLRLADNVTEILTYSFGDAAKFEGFGKTLREPLDVDRLSQLTVAAEIQTVVIYKLTTVRLPRPSSATATSYHRDHRPAPYPHHMSAAAAAGFNSVAGRDSFQVRDSAVDCWYSFCCGLFVCLSVCLQDDVNAVQVVIVRFTQQIDNVTYYSNWTQAAQRRSANHSPTTAVDI